MLRCQGEIALYPTKCLWCYKFCWHRQLPRCKALVPGRCPSSYVIKLVYEKCGTIKQSFARSQKADVNEKALLNSGGLWKLVLSQSDICSALFSVCTPKSSTGKKLWLKSIWMTKTGSMVNSVCDKKGRHKGFGSFGNMSSLRWTGVFNIA